MTRPPSLRSRASVGVLLLTLGVGMSAPVSAAIPPTERQVLLNLYSSTNGAGWTNRTNWNGAAGTECLWYGIVCDAGQTHVQSVLLSGNNLVGTLPAITDLTALRNFYVGNNHLSGSLPTLTGLTDLVGFNAFSNQFTGPIPSLAGLTNLGLFAVDDNRLTGSMPSLAGLTNLNNFYVGRNQLTGAIPALTGLSHLTDFNVEDNQLSGTIPSLVGLTQLARLRVGNNQLSSAMPAVPTPTSNLQPGISDLCPNNLDLTPNPAWDVATGSTPWYRDCLAAAGDAQAVPAVSPFGLAALTGLLGLAGLGLPRRRS